MKLLISFFVLFALSHTSFASTATCRGEVEGNGHFAFSFSTGFSGKIILRGCSVVGHIAKHFGEAPKNYDTFVMDGFGDVRCEKISEEPYSVSCKMNNALMAEPLRDDIGVEFRKVMQLGGIQFQQAMGNSLAFEFWTDVPGQAMLKKKFVLTKVTCDNEEIKPDEGKCL